MQRKVGVNFHSYSKFQKVNRIQSHYKNFQSSKVSFKVPLLYSKKLDSIISSRKFSSLSANSKEIPIETYVTFPKDSKLPQEYKFFKEKLVEFIPKERIIDDPLRTLAYGTDASFYRLIPKIVVHVESEEEVQKIIKLANQTKISITFRAAGTSLSGQAITDSVMVRIVPSKWNKYELLTKDASIIKLQPGIIGGKINSILAPFQKKIGPDPSSIDSCMIGGITANNSSGMCCGVAQNTYHTLQNLRLILSDGTILDTANSQSKEEFKKTHGQFLQRLTELSNEVKSNPTLAARIQEKYKIKNTTGYSINSLVDFTDPFDILTHLIVGSEGTLAFISDVTIRTVDELPFKASSLMIFPNIIIATEAVKILKRTPVDAVEIMDGACLQSVSSHNVIPSGLSLDAAALLVETRASTKEQLNSRINQIVSSLSSIETIGSIAFTDIPAKYNALWDIRKGLIPSAGATRPKSTSTVIEDVAVVVPKLADFMMDLQKLFKKFKYHDAIILGHALEGNLHLIFAQSWKELSDIQRFENLMKELCDLVVKKYDGSLKGEHGTGRNVAPFVEMEWGNEAYKIMKKVKELFDPKEILNRGVLLNEDQDIFIKNLKLMPEANHIIDQCIECGFCEKNCPSRELTLTPRQRIVIIREMARLESSGKDPERLDKLRKEFQYLGESTCAADGMCAVSCPVSIDTGKFIKYYRSTKQSNFTNRIADMVANRFAFFSSMARLGLTMVDFSRKTIGDSVVTSVSQAIHKFGSGYIPVWNSFIPKAAPSMNLKFSFQKDKGSIVYIPSCVNRIFGNYHNTPSDHPTLYQKSVELIERAGYNVVSPLKDISNLCCGLAFASKGFPKASERKSAEMEKFLLDVSSGGKHPVYCDASPCVLHMKMCMSSIQTKQLKLVEPIQLVQEYLLPHLDIEPIEETVCIHTPCSSKKMGLEPGFREVAKKCATKVVESQVPCCGMAGDRGLLFPELTGSSLKQLKGLMKATNCSEGISTSRTCEIGLSTNTDTPYHNLLFLVDKAQKKKQTK